MGTGQGARGKWYRLNHIPGDLGLYEVIESMAVVESMIEHQLRHGETRLRETTHQTGVVPAFRDV